MKVATILLLAKAALAIVGGTPVSPSFSLSWVAYQRLNGEFSDCSGSLLNPTTYLTAAHCSFYRDPADPNLVVVANRFNQTNPAEEANEVVFKVKSINVHPKYNSSDPSYAFDFAVWKVEVAKGNLTRICFDAVIQQYDSTPVGALFNVVGWGHTLNTNVPPYEDVGPTSPVLLTTTVALISQQSCINEYKTAFPITPSSICAASRGKDACDGDSGGPLFRKVNGKQTIVGLVSNGIGCADPLHAGIYSRVAYVSSWIIPQLTNPRRA